MNMNKLILILCMAMMCMAPLAKGQQTIADPDRMWTVPAIYTMDEPVTWNFDFASAEQLNDGEPLYLWIWAPTNPTGAPIPLTYSGERIWSITFTPTDFFGMTVEELWANTENFYFLLRNLDANKLTGTLSLPKQDAVKSFVESGEQFAFAPSDFRLGSTLSILFNANLVADFLPAPASVHLHAGLNDWDAKQEFQAWLPDVREKTAFRHIGNGIYKKDIIPESYFGVTDEYEMENLVFLAVKYNGNDAQPDWAGASPDFRIIAPGVPEPLPPALSFFPLKISARDVLVITRDNNIRGQRLSYTITGGSKTISGNLEGNMARQRAYINIQKEFSGQTIDKIHLLIKDQNGVAIYNQDMALMKEDDLLQ